MRVTALLLGLCQFLFMAAAAVGISFNGLVGERLAPSAALATFPFLFVTFSTALVTLILPRLFGRLGYRGVFVLGAAFGSAGGLLCAWAVGVQSFWLFCLACFLIGGYQASALYYRFAAADTAASADKGNAIAWVLSGGILAALIGPMLGRRGLQLLEVEYQGAYVLTAALALFALPILIMTALPARKESRTTAVEVPVRELLAHPALLPALLFCAGGYALMMFIMLASPLAMHHGGYGAADAASVIQWHLLGMFAPSLLTGKLIGRYGARPVALSGCAILGSGCVVALSGMALAQFHWALLLVGIGWNFMYMGGSTLLSDVSDERERSRLQALTEFSTFTLMTLVAAGTGWFYLHLGWTSLLGMTLLVVLTIAVLAGLRRPLAQQASAEKIP